MSDERKRKITQGSMRRRRRNGRRLIVVHLLGGSVESISTSFGDDDLDIVVVDESVLVPGEEREAVQSPWHISHAALADAHPSVWAAVLAEIGADAAKA